MAKRIISLLLAAVSLLALWVPAYAEEPAAEEPAAQQTDVPEPEEPEIPEEDEEPEEPEIPEENEEPEVPEIPEEDEEPEVPEMPEEAEEPEIPEETEDDGDVSEADAILLGETETRAASPRMEQVGGKWYGFDANGKKLLGWQIIEGKKYFFETKKSSGVRASGWKKIKSGKVTRKYYFDPETGEMKTGLTTVGKYTYYLQSGDLKEVATGAMKTGWQTVDGKTYYFSKAKSMLGQKRTGWITVSKKRYYLDADGVRLTGLQGIDGHDYYLDAKTGAMKTGWQTVDGKTYYFSKAKSMLGQKRTGWITVSKKNYYLDADGVRLTGLQEIEGHEYYLDAKTGAMKTGWQTIEGKTYYFSKAKSMLGQKRTGWITVSKKQYYLDADGVRQTGLQEIEGHEYYLDAKTGAMKTGWQKIDGKTYYFSKAKSMLGQKRTGWITVSSKKYYLGDDGVRRTGWQTIDGKRYYFSSSGVMASGLEYIKSKGEMYYFSSDGVLQTNTKITRCRKTYTVNGDGVIVGYVTAAGRKAISILDKKGWSLWNAYIWAASLPYSNRGYRAGSIETYAKYGFNNRTGNCYVMNSCLYEMAKMLGYDVRMVSGGVRNSSGGANPHGWCEIKIGGKWYVYDSNFHNETGRNGYKIKYGQSGTWQYVKYGYLS